jgi:uncharacterized membrane protein
MILNCFLFILVALNCLLESFVFSKTFALSVKSNDVENLSSEVHSQKDVQLKLKRKKRFVCPSDGKWPDETDCGK